MSIGSLTLTLKAGVRGSSGPFTNRERIRGRTLMAQGRAGSMVALLGLHLVAVNRIAAAPVPADNADAHRVSTSRPGVPALTIPPGTNIPATLDENVTLQRDRIGNAFPAHITRDVMVDGAIAIPRGAPAEVTLVESEDTPNAASFRLVSISIDGRMRPVRTGVAETDAPRSGMSTSKKTGIGAIAGGAIGLIVGGGTGLLKGAVVGAGGGLAWGLLSHESRRVEQGTPLLFLLRNPIRVE